MFITLEIIVFSVCFSPFLYQIRAVFHYKLIISRQFPLTNSGNFILSILFVKNNRKNLDLIFTVDFSACEPVIYIL